MRPRLDECTPVEELTVARRAQMRGDVMIVRREEVSRIEEWRPTLVNRSRSGRAMMAAIAITAIIVADWRRRTPRALALCPPLPPLQSPPLCLSHS